MSRALRVCETIHVVVAGVWLGSLVMTGVVVALLFPAMRGLGPTLPEFAAYGGDHWRLAAGQIAARVFLASDMVQFGGLILCGMTFGLAVLAFGRAMDRLTALRGVVLVLLVAALSYQFFVLAADMNANLRRYWDAARAGDTAAAEGFRAAFEARHPTATRLLVADTLLVLALLIAGVWAQGVGAARPTRDGYILEEPLLARKAS